MISAVFPISSFIASAVTGPMAAYKGLSESSGLQNPPACLNARTPEGLANISTRHNDSCSSIRFEGTPFTAEAMKEEIGKTADIIAESYHIPGLVKAVIDGTAPFP